MKLALRFILLLNFALCSPLLALAGPGDNTTPWPLGQSPVDLVGIWSNPVHHYILTVQLVPAAKGQVARLFVVLNDSYMISRGYLYYTPSGFCGVINQDDGGNARVCLRGRYGLVAVQAEQKNIYFSARHRMDR